MKAKAIQTRYAGHWFRSRLEARWATLFDAAGIEWEYEVQGYELASGYWYLPDFWLPQVCMWAEVKPTRLDAVEFQKCWELAQGTGFDVLLLDGRPERRLYSVLSHSKIPWTEEFSATCCDILERHRLWETQRRFWGEIEVVGQLPTRSGREPHYWSDEWVSHDQQAERWIEAANSARFEHGDAA